MAGMNWGPIILNEEEWAEFMETMNNPQPPTQAALDGAEQLRKLYGTKPSPQKTKP